MKIVIQKEEKPVEETECPEVSLDDDGFNVPGWVTIAIGDKRADIHIDELYHATLALWAKYRDQLSKEAEAA